MLKLRAAASVGAFQAKAFKDLVEEGQGLTPLENADRRHFVRRLQVEPFLGQDKVQRQEELSAPALLRLCPFAFVYEIIAQRDEQERAKPARTRGNRQGLLEEQPCEKLLGSVLRILRAVTSRRRNAYTGYQ